MSSYPKEDFSNNFCSNSQYDFSPICGNSSSESNKSIIMKLGAMILYKIITSIIGDEIVFIRELFCVFSE